MINTYAAMLPELRAARQLAAIEAAAAPHMEQSKLQALIRRYTRPAGGDSSSPSLHEALSRLPAVRVAEEPAPAGRGTRSDTTEGGA